MTTDIMANADINFETITLLSIQKIDIVSAESDTLDLSMRQKASQLVKNAMDNVKRERKSEKEKKLQEREEKNKNTFKDLYNMVSKSISKVCPKKKLSES